MPDGLILEDETDYLMPEGCESIWITINNLSIYVRRELTGVAIVVYPLHDEMNESLATVSVPFPEEAT